MITLDEQLENWKAVQYRIREEGMDYCFEHYSSWEEIKDEKFHQLKETYLESVKNLNKYIDDNIIEIEDMIFNEEN